MVVWGQQGGSLEGQEGSSGEGQGGFRRFPSRMFKDTKPPWALVLLGEGQHKGRLTDLTSDPSMPGSTRGVVAGVFFQGSREKLLSAAAEWREQSFCV